ncbi:MAG: hypothetical protein M0C28_01725 [Candidatus Moduliflexus flocculans]|nr:hypothetical protein [Candidatus Moduliflexus flocculans]
MKARSTPRPPARRRGPGRTSAPTSRSGSTPKSRSRSAPRAGRAGLRPPRVRRRRRGTGALYRITADGLAKRLWVSEDEMIYTLLYREADGKVLFGTGGQGRIYAVDREERVALLLQQSSEQVYQLAPLDSKIYVLSNNPCYFGLLLPEQRFAGEYTSPVLDARTPASWGRLVWDAAVAAGASVQLQSRSGNTNEPNATWSDWSPFYGKTEEQVLSPKSRYLQVKVTLRTQTGKSSPVFDRLAVFYLQSNVAPSVSRLEFLRPNEVYLKLPDQDDVILGVERNAPEAPGKKDELRVSLGYRKSERKGFQTVVWDAADENGDTLRYSLAMKKDGEAEWRVLEPDWTEPIYAFDTLSFPDGTYLLRLTASDAPSNPSGLELKADKTSPAFVIDNSLPVVKGLHGGEERRIARRCLPGGGRLLLHRRGQGVGPAGGMAGRLPRRRDRRFPDRVVQVLGQATRRGGEPGDREGPGQLRERRGVPAGLLRPATSSSARDTCRPACRCG